MDDEKENLNDNNNNNYYKNIEFWILTILHNATKSVGGTVIREEVALVPLLKLILKRATQKQQVELAKLITEILKTVA